MKPVYYRGYRITPTPRGLYRVEFKLTYMNRYIFAEYTDSIQEAKADIDRHMEGRK